MKKRILVLSLVLIFALSFAMFTPALAAGEYKATLMGQMDVDVSDAVDEWGLGDLPEASVSFSLGSEATISMKFDSPVKFSGNWTGISTDLPVSGDDAAEATGAKITSFKVDGKELGSKAVPLIDRDNSGFLTIDIARQWGGDYDAYNLKGMIPFSSIEITFIVPDPAASGASDGGETAATSPKTGDNIFIGIALVLLVLSGAAVLVIRKIKA